jgi:hypothetical protein
LAPQKTRLFKLASFFIKGISFSRMNSLPSIVSSTEAVFSSNNLTTLDEFLVDEVIVYKDFLRRVITHSTLEKCIFPLRLLTLKLSFQLKPSGLLKVYRTLNKFFKLYRHFGQTSLLTLHKKHYSLRQQFIPELYFLYWTFTKTHRLYINMRNQKEINYNYLSLSPGMFLKFYNNKRPLKRSKLFKLLVVKFLRKLLIAAGVVHFYVIVRRSPTLFSELFKKFMTPDINPYLLPGRKAEYDDSSYNTSRSVFSTYKFIFAKTKFFGTFKDRRRGRLKRKIARRLIKKNNILD